ncbi:helix-turn-helix domain-containing protein [Burkholderia vietnamiensis]|nr:helix-turn-helix domain-containing protein [Burkholderia vietnamiensis]
MCHRDRGTREFLVRHHPRERLATMRVIHVPSPSALLRQQIKTISDDLSTVIERTYAALGDIDGYEDLPISVKKDIVDSISISERLWFQSIVDGEFPDNESLKTFQDFGRRRVHQGISLQSLLRAFRMALREVWRACADLGSKHDILRDELLFEISPYLMDYFDHMSQLISSAYLDEQYRQARWQESLRYQLHDVVFSRSRDDDAFRKITKALGLDHAVPRIAVALASSALDGEPIQADRALDQIVQVTAGILKTSRDTLVDARHHDRLVIWVPSIQQESASASDRRVAEYMATLQERLPSVTSIGIGLAGVGAQGWAASADEAIRALDFGNRFAPDQKVHRYSDIVIEECIRGNDSALNYFLSLLNELSVESGATRTIEAFFTNRRRRKVTAAALDIHPNTLDHRLERVESILGAKLDDARWIAKLEIALKLRDVACALPA